MAVATQLASVHAFAAHIGLHTTLADLLVEINRAPEVDIFFQTQRHTVVVFASDIPGEVMFLTKSAVIAGLQELIDEHSSVATFREVLEDEAAPFASAYDVRAEADEDEDDAEDEDEDDEDEDDDDDEDFDDDDEDDDEDFDDEDDDEDDDWEEVDDDDDDEDDDDDDDEDDDE